MSKCKIVMIVLVLTILQIVSCSVGHVTLKERRCRVASRMAERRRLLNAQGSRLPGPRDTPTRLDCRGSDPIDAKPLKEKVYINGKEIGK